MGLQSLQCKIRTVHGGGCANCSSLPGQSRSASGSVLARAADVCGGTRDALEWRQLQAAALGGKPQLEARVPGARRWGGGERTQVAAHLWRRGRWPGRGRAAERGAGRGGGEGRKRSEGGSWGERRRKGKRKRSGGMGGGVGRTRSGRGGGGVSELSVWGIVGSSHGLSGRSPASPAGSCTLLRPSRARVGAGQGLRRPGNHGECGREGAGDPQDLSPAARAPRLHSLDLRLQRA